MTFSPTELLQTGAALAGAGLTLKAKVSADLNLITLRRQNINGSRRILAEKNVRIENGHLRVQLLLFVVGLITLVLAPPPFVPPIESIADNALLRQANLQFTISRLCMTLISLYLMYLSYRSWVEERIPVLLATRKTDSLSGNSVHAAQTAANIAQSTATIAQTAASAAQDTATISQQVATQAADDEHSEQQEKIDRPNRN